MKKIYNQSHPIIFLSITVLASVLCNAAFASEIKYWEQTGFWHENRMMILGALIILLILFYKSVWVSYGKILKLYRGHYFPETEPSLTAPQASYLLSQDGVSSFLAWLIQRCQSGTLKLHYKKNRPTPWYISSNKTETPDASLDNELMNALFSDETRINIEGAFSADPNPKIKRAFNKFTKYIKTDLSGLVQKKPASFPAWLLVGALIAEMPYFIGWGSNDSIFFAFTASFLVIITALLTYALHRLLPLFVPSVISLTIAALGIAILTAVAIAFHGVLVEEFAPPYMTMYFYPEVVTAIGVLALNAPVIPKDMNLLAQIYGYRSYLGKISYPIKEQDLAWTLGLETHTFGDMLQYQASQLPKWLTTDEKDIQKMITSLHQDLPSAVRRAIFGQSTKGLKRSRSRSDFSRR